METFEEKRSRILEGIASNENLIDLETGIGIDIEILDTREKKFTAAMYVRNITVLGKYINVTTKIDFKCDSCENLWTGTPRLAILKGCPKCWIVNRNLQIEMKIWEKTMLILKDKKGKVVKFPVYNNRKPKISDTFTVRCDLGSHFFVTSHKYLRRDRWCPVCMKTARYTNILKSNFVYGQNSDKKNKFQRKLLGVCGIKGVKLQSLMQPDKTYRIMCSRCGEVSNKTIKQIFSNIFLCSRRCVKSEKIKYESIRL